MPFYTIPREEIKIKFSLECAMYITSTLHYIYFTLHKYFTLQAIHCVSVHEFCQFRWVYVIMGSTHCANNTETGQAPLYM